MESDYEYIFFPPEKWELSDSYFLDNYGRCIVLICACSMNGWLGQNCFNWRPLGARSWNDLSQSIKEADDGAQRNP